LRFVEKGTPASNRLLVNIRKLIAGFGKILDQSGAPSELARERSELCDHPCAVCLQLCFKILQDDFPGLFIEPEIAISRQTRDSALDFPDHLLSRSTK
jgi:hypothetical protein